MRLNIDFDDSDWVDSLSAESQLAWIKLLCHAKRDGSRGKVRVLGSTRAASKWKVKPKSVTDMIAAAIADGALVIENDTWIVTKWAVYQPEDPNNVERQRKFREKLNLDNAVILTHNAVMPGHNGGITALHCRATETETYTGDNLDPRDTSGQTPKKVSSRMVKPSQDDVAALFREKGSSGAEARKFWNHYEANGWKVGKNPMRNWRAAVAGWIERALQPSNGHGKGFTNGKPTGTAQAQAEQVLKEIYGTQ